MHNDNLVYNDSYSNKLILSRKYYLLLMIKLFVFLDH